MPTRNVVLTPHQHKLVDQLVASGQYQNASEVLRAGLRLIERQQAEDNAKLDALRRAADIGWADLSSGSYVDIDDADLETYVSRLGNTVG